ncbi:hypothetical protein DNTS_015281 [Danionella cerebrum]|uniref:Peptidase S1 domain-containing protein n=1 Tax=Danionella cerebrum TaxID=2873325 RepID=A0A553RQ18_9TELE|nr:hypothetical protein DNTS_015281 [Danionella translucida]
MWKQTVVTLLLLICINRSLSDNSEICGRRGIIPRIMGGKDATHGNWPWMALIKDKNGGICGGTLINKQWVLTAAHCGDNNSKLSVYLGAWQKDTLSERERRTKQKIDVNTVYHHPDYPKNDLDNDIALLKLSSAIEEFTEFIRPVCLADKDSKFDVGTVCWVAGWGQTEYEIPLFNDDPLQEAQIEVFSNAYCEAYWAHAKNMICTGSAKGIKLPMMGDSGGPLMNDQCSFWVQFGVINNGFNAANNGANSYHPAFSPYLENP